MNDCKLTPFKLLTVIVAFVWATQAFAEPVSRTNRLASNARAVQNAQADKSVSKQTDKQSAKQADKKSVKKSADKPLKNNHLAEKKSANKKPSDKKTTKNSVDKKVVDKKATAQKQPKQPAKSQPAQKSADKKLGKTGSAKQTPIKQTSVKQPAKQSVKVVAKKTPTKTTNRANPRFSKHIPYQHLRHTAKKHGIDPLLVKAIIKVESGGKPNARSRKGAVGLMQVMPATARQYGRYNLKDPKQNITVGVRHFSNLKKRYKNTKIALAAYNAGEGNVDKYGGIPPFGETRRYVANTMATYRAFKQNKAVRA